MREERSLTKQRRATTRLGNARTADVRRLRRTTIMRGHTNARAKPSTNTDALTNARLVYMHGKSNDTHRFHTDAGLTRTRVRRSVGDENNIFRTTYSSSFFVSTIQLRHTATHLRNNRDRLPVYVSRFVRYVCGCVRVRVCQTEILEISEIINRYVALFFAFPFNGDHILCGISLHSYVAMVPGT